MFLRLPLSLNFSTIGCKGSESGPLGSNLELLILQYVSLPRQKSLSQALVLREGIMAACYVRGTPTLEAECLVGGGTPRPPQLASLSI